jgi:uncharacterized protein YvpB
MKSKFLRSSKYILAGMVAATVGLGAYTAVTLQSLKNSPDSGYELPKPAPKPASPPESEDTVSIKDEVSLEVPFVVQAPFGVWDEIHDDTCEEASLMMAYYFLMNKALPDLTAVDQELIGLVSWQTARGYKYDVTLAELVEIARGYYNLEGAKIISNPTVADLKLQLSLGRPVIVPAAGKLLPNPNFRGDGPNYHMLVIKGYDRTHFVTNDPGTRNGNSFRYRYEDLMNALHDYDPVNMLNGRRAVLVFEN